VERFHVCFDPSCERLHGYNLVVVGLVRFVCYEYEPFPLVMAEMIGVMIDDNIVVTVVLIPTSAPAAVSKNGLCHITKVVLRGAFWEREKCNAYKEDVKGFFWEGSWGNLPRELYTPLPAPPPP
jgi:hypothetical protein